MTWPVGSRVQHVIYTRQHSGNAGISRIQRQRRNFLQIWKMNFVEETPRYISRLSNSQLRGFSGAIRRLQVADRGTR